MELSLYSLCTDRTVNSPPIVGTECLLNNCPATISYVVSRTVESSPWQRDREVFTATLYSSIRGPARLGSARYGTARYGEDTALTIHVTVYCLFYPLVRNVPSDLQPSNGGPSTVDCVTMGTCLPNRCLAMVIFVTVLLVLLISLCQL
jgi:hypothetical protein